MKTKTFKDIVTYGEDSVFYKIVSKSGATWMIHLPAISAVVQYGDGEYRIAFTNGTIVDFDLLVPANETFVDYFCK